MMLRHFPTYAFLFFLAHPALLYAQGGHNDIVFDYQDNQIDIKANALTGGRIGLGTFRLTGLFRQFSDQPGFASETDVGNGVNPSDTIVYNVLDNLLYWNGVDFAAPDPNTQIRIDNNGAAPDTIVHGSSGHQAGGFNPLKNLIDQADGLGNIHDHVDFWLEPNNSPLPPPLPQIGAYGLKLSLSTNAVGIADSDPWLAVFNFGLDTAGFEDAVDRFAELLAPDLPGDYDRNGTVDSDDYLLWRQQFGSPPITSGSGADGNSDGVINAADYTVWRDNLGAAATGVELANSMFAVPEPSTAAIVASAAFGLIVAGHRRRVCRAFSQLSYPLQK